MQNKTDVQTRVGEYLAEQGVSVRELARRIGIPEATLGRMLRADAAYRGQRHRWEQLAQYPPLGLDPAAVLAAVGFGPAAAPTPELSAWQHFEEAMRIWGIPSEYRKILRAQVEYHIREYARHPTSAS